MRNVKVNALFFLLGLLVAAAVILVPMAQCAPDQAQLERAQLGKEVEQLAQQSAAFSDAFAKTIEYVMPAVVSISTTQTVTVSDRALPFGPEDFFFELPDPFGRPRQPRRERPRAQPREREFKRSGLGSGFVVDAKKGYIVTNVHVVKGIEAEDITVTFQDGQETQALEVFQDPKTEAAVIKVDPDGLVGLEWGDSENLRAGQWVIAVGSPMGLGNTATAGIISATSTRDRVFGGGRRMDLRLIQNPYAVEDYIQTDAAINPGNSGGPLVTLDGKVIGINTLIVSSTGGSVGLGFAVPERIAEPVVNQLIENGRVIRGHLGVSILNPYQVTDLEAKEAFGLESAEEAYKEYKFKKDDEGALVGEVLAGGPADKAGIETGDLITSIGDTATPDVDTLRETVSAIEPDTRVDVTVRRKGKEEKLQVLIGEQPRDTSAFVKGSAKIGVIVQELTADVASFFGYPADLKGVIISKVTAGSPAARAGLAQGDVIMRVDGKDVASVQEFMAATREFDEKGIELTVRSGADTETMRLKP